MKFNRLVAALGIALAGFAGVSSAAERLFSQASNRSQIANPGELLRQVASDPANARIDIVAANPKQVSADTQEINLSLPGGI